MGLLDLNKRLATLTDTLISSYVTGVCSSALFKESLFNATMGRLKHYLRKLPLLSIPTCILLLVVLTSPNMMSLREINYYNQLFGAEHRFSRGYICKARHVSLSRLALPMTGLVSFPGSGNTWVRHLIQQMTGKWSRLQQYRTEVLILTNVR